jgi:hypothetical protein
MELSASAERLARIALWQPSPGCECDRYSSERWARRLSSRDRRRCIRADLIFGKPRDFDGQLGDFVHRDVVAGGDVIDFEVLGLT